MTVSKASYIANYSIEITFSNKEKREVNFEPFLDANLSIHFKKYKELDIFKKFYIDNGNIVWDEDWTLIFPVDDLYKNNLLH